MSGIQLISFYFYFSGVLTNDINKAMIVAEKIEAGTCFVNVYNKTDVAAPFGGKIRNLNFLKRLKHFYFYFFIFRNETIWFWKRSWSRGFERIFENENCYF